MTGLQLERAALTAAGRPAAIRVTKALQLRLERGDRILKRAFAVPVGRAQASYVAQSSAAVTDYLNRQGIIGIGEVAYVKLARNAPSVSGSIAFVGAGE